MPFLGNLKSENHLSTTNPSLSKNLISYDPNICSLQLFCSLTIKGVSFDRPIFDKDSKRLLLDFISIIFIQFINSFSWLDFSKFHLRVFAKLKFVNKMDKNKEYIIIFTIYN